MVDFALVSICDHKQDAHVYPHGFTLVRSLWPFRLQYYLSGAWHNDIFFKALQRYSGKNDAKPLNQYSSTET